MLVNITVLNPKEIIFEGSATRITVPGEMGIFEVLPMHKPILSRLISGTLMIDQKEIPIRRGVIKVRDNSVTAIVENE